VVFKTRTDSHARPWIARRTRTIAALGAAVALAGFGAAVPAQAAGVAGGSGAIGGGAAPVSNVVQHATVAPRLSSGDPNAQAVVAPPPAAPYGEFIPVTPVRALDTRDGTGQPGPGPIGQFQTRTLQITGRNGIPATGVAAVVLNVTVDAPSYGGYLTVWPSGQAQPGTSNLNFVAGQTVPNLVTVAVGGDGAVELYNFLGRVDAIADIMGYYSSSTGAPGSRYHSVTPNRIVDTRTGQGVSVAGQRAAGSVTQVNFHTGATSGATAVVLNVTVTGPTGSGFFTVYPDDAARPTSSNLNFVPGTTRANQVIVKVPASGVVDFYIGGVGTSDMVIDISGYYDNVKTTDAGRFVPVSPYRTVDTRYAPAADGRIQPGTADILTVPGDPRLPQTGIGAVLINLTSVDQLWNGFLRVFPTDVATLPGVSALNFELNSVVPNHVITQLSTTATTFGGQPAPVGSFAIYDSVGATQVVVDMFGWFTS
jgi:hypothetical protein